MVVQSRSILRFVSSSSVARGVALLFALLVQPLMAQEWSLQPYAYSSLSESGEVNNEDYLVPLSVPRRVNNQLRIEKELRVDVTGIKETHRINDGHTTQQAFDHYLSVIKQLGGQVLYQCSSRDCGRSSSWAQNIYNISKLYGEDASQFYMVAQVQHNNASWLVTVYAVERGNRRVYAHVETLKLNSPLSGVAAPIVTGKALPLFIFNYDVNGVVSINPSLSDFNKIISLSRDNANVKIYILGYLQTGYSSTQEAIKRSTDAANQISTLLAKRGVSASKMIVKGLGPLVPFGQSPHTGNRVEVLVVDE